MSTARNPYLSLSGDPLRIYKSKRNFAHTPEPADGGVASTGQLRFVVQKHWASSLHYDFRLELGGTMKSWAVPKGPSFDPKIKRMAVQVEDHPISYSEFEGTVPPKQYGAGKVIVWDTGTWVSSSHAQQGYRDGNLKFELHGHKLHGKWVLIRMKGRGEKQAPWLLIKETDAFVRSAAEYSVVDELPDSIMALRPSKRSAKGVLNVVGNPPRKAKAKAHAHAQPKTVRATSTLNLPPEAELAALPDTLLPQLATLAAGPPPNPEVWLYEIKFDGYRILVRNDSAGTRLLTRNGHDWTTKLRPLQKAIEGLKLPPGWYDGEIVVPNDEGIPDFGALQQSFDIDDTNDVVIYLFDLPYIDGHDLRAAPLEARRMVLQRLLSASPSDTVRFSELFNGSLDSVVASACKLGLEGVIAKRRNSRYQSGRSADWIKLKCSRRQEFVIGGYTDPRGSRTGFGSLLLGVHDAQGALQYAGNVGTGFSQAALVDIKKALDARRRTKSPFADEALIEGRPHWIDPTLVAQVSFGEWTRSGRIRHAVFLGLRTDKDASTIVRERALPRSTMKASSTTSRTKSHALSSRLNVTNPQRVIDASRGTTKIELLRYYGLVGDLMMRHLKGRPLSLVRAPTGVDGQLFFQKHTETEKLPGMRQLDPALSSGHPPMIEVASKLGLLSAAQWNVVEFHTMNAGSATFEHPDRMVFDIDPGAGVPWAQVQEAAQLTHAFLTQLGLPTFLKTSGGKGLHLVVPVRKVHDWDTVKGFSQAIVLHMAQTIPQRFVARSGPKNRVGKIFIDYLRNGLGATTVSAWSARARPGLGISVPVAWSELSSLRGGDHWTVETVHERLDTGNAPWNDYAKAARSLTAAMSALGHAPAHQPTLAHVPVALYPASQEVGIDFDWLDKRSMDPVGYKRVNKRTGKEIQSSDIVKGIKQDDGDYVILTDDQIKAAYPKSTQTIEIESFVKASEISFILLETPYYLEPIGKGEKVYALLREAMFEAGVIGIARVVLHTKEHLAALVPSGAALVLNTIRWASEIRAVADLKLPAEGKTTAGLKPTELKMAAQLISDMTGPWKSGDYSDKFSDAVQALVSKKVAAGQTETVTPLEDAPSPAGVTNVVDLTELLAKSLAKRKPAGGSDGAAAAVAGTGKKTAPKSPTRKRA